MCFSPQPRAIFRHLNFKKWSRIVSFLTFSLSNVLFATAASNFSKSVLRKVLRSWRVFYIFTSKCAFRHSGVQFLISPLSSYLRTRRFNRPTFGARMYLLSSAFRAIASSCCWLDYSTAELCICFSTVHIVGSFSLNFLRQYIVIVYKNTPVHYCAYIQYCMQYYIHICV